MPQEHPIFCYGTLKRGFGNHVVIARHLTRPVEAAVLNGARLFDLGAPGVALPENGRGYPVRGELVWVNDEGLARADYLENHPDTYRRVRRTVRVGERKLKAWVYTLPEWWLERTKALELTEGEWPGRKRGR